MASPAISVVIPAYNRPEELRLCLDGFAKQTVPQDCFEVIVVDDGSTVDIAAAASEFTRSQNIHLIRSAHAGPGAARNIALNQALAPLLVLYDDDLRPLPDLIEYSLDFHRSHPAESDLALLKFQPDPAIADSVFVNWAFERLYPFPKTATISGWARFWSGTITTKKSLFRHGEFDPAYMMLEDAELGLRLSRSVDLRVYFECRRTGTLTRRLTFDQIYRRQYTLGYFSCVLARQYQGAVNFSFPPYDDPEKYLVDDRRKLAAIIASARAMESREQKLRGSDSPQPTEQLAALWGTADVHARASGWMDARDGRPAVPPGTGWFSAPNNPPDPS